MKIDNMRIAEPERILYESPSPKEIFCYSPGICRLESGRLVATIDLGGPGCSRPIGKCFLSDDRGANWRHVLDFPFHHARPFSAGNSLYILGFNPDLAIVRSVDDGDTWSEPAALTRGECWHQAPCNVCYANSCVYLVMERRCSMNCRGWYVSELAPVLMRGKTGDDLGDRKNWTFASEIMFRDAFPDSELIRRGMSFFPIVPDDGCFPAPGRDYAPPGWLETNVVQIRDSEHYWYDPAGKTFHLLARLHNGWTGYAALLKVVEQGEKPGSGEMITGFQKLPSGGECRVLPLPGGQMKFHLLYDEISELYWLLSTQATDSMTRAELLPADRYNLPNNQRCRLTLHFSKNLVDWCFAGLVAAGGSELQSRHYASMTIDGDDLAVLARSGNEQAASAHNGNLITFHPVKNFRDLVY